MTQDETDKLVSHLAAYLDDCGFFEELFGEEEAEEVCDEIEAIVYEHVGAAGHRHAAGV